MFSTNMGAGLSRGACVQNIRWNGKIGKSYNKVLNTRISCNTYSTISMWQNFEARLSDSCDLLVYFRCITFNRLLVASDNSLWCLYFVVTHLQTHPHFMFHIWDHTFFFLSKTMILHPHGSFLCFFLAKSSFSTAT